MKLNEIIKETLNSKTATNTEIQIKTEFFELCAIKAFNAGYRVYNVWVSFSDSSINDILSESTMATSNEEAENNVLNRLDSRVKDYVLTYGSDLQE